jgi:hypothetical protein
VVNGVAFIHLLPACFGKMWCIAELYAGQGITRVDGDQPGRRITGNIHYPGPGGGAGGVAPAMAHSDRSARDWQARNLAVSC